MEIKFKIYTKIKKKPLPSFPIMKRVVGVPLSRRALEHEENGLLMRHVVDQPSANIHQEAEAAADVQGDDRLHLQPFCERGGG